MQVAFFNNALKSLLWLGQATGQVLLSFSIVNVVSNYTK